MAETKNLPGSLAEYAIYDPRDDDRRILLHDKAGDDVKRPAVILYEGDRAAFENGEIHEVRNDQLVKISGDGPPIDREAFLAISTALDNEAEVLRSQATANANELRGLANHLRRIVKGIGQ